MQRSLRRHNIQYILFFTHYEHYVILPFYIFLLFFFFNDTATTEIYTLSLHDALPISAYLGGGARRRGGRTRDLDGGVHAEACKEDARRNRRTHRIRGSSARCGPMDRRVPAGAADDYPRGYGDGIHHRDARAPGANRAHVLGRARRHRACGGSRLGLVPLRTSHQSRAFFPSDLDLPRLVCAAAARIRVPRGHRGKRAADQHSVLAHRYRALRSRRAIRRDFDLRAGPAARAVDRLVGVWRKTQRNAGRVVSGDPGRRYASGQGISGSQPVSVSAELASHVPYCSSTRWETY